MSPLVKFKCLILFLGLSSCAIAETLNFNCSASDYQSGSIWGSGIYTDDSSRCRAAVHSGKLVAGQTGTCTFQTLAGQSSYPSTLGGGGITSSSWGVWGGSFQIVSCSATSAVTTTTTTVPVSSTFTCGATDYQSGSIWGSGIYTDDSSRCRAAVHSGKLVAGQTGTCTFQTLAGQSSYPSTLGGGAITSSSWGAWGGSFQIVSCSGTSATSSTTTTLSPNSGLIVSLDATNNQSYPGTGDTWYDLSGLNNNARLYNGANFNNSNAIVFDGVNDFAEIVSNSALNNALGADFTFDLWFRPLVPVPTSYPYGKVFSKGNWSGTGGFNGINYFQSGSLITLQWQYHDSSQTYRKLLQTQIEANSWLHLVYTRANGIFQLYINGQLVASEVNSDNFSSPAFNLRIGGNYQPDNFAHIEVSKFKLFNRALTSNQILTNYQSYLNTNSAVSNSATTTTFTCGATDYQSGAIWGSGIYTDDSSRCRAAVHSGKLVAGQTGTCTMQTLAGQSSYPSTLGGGGITSSSWGAWGGSFQIVSCSGTCFNSWPALNLITSGTVVGNSTGAIWRDGAGNGVYADTKPYRVIYGSGTGDNGIKFIVGETVTITDKTGTASTGNVSGTYWVKNLSKYDGYDALELDCSIQCQAGYYLSNGVCKQDCAPNATSSQACAVANGTGTQSRTCSASGQWGTFGSCELSSCNAGFYLSGGICKQDCAPNATSSQACAVANGTGTQSRTCSASGQWGTFGSCVLSSCNAGYYQNNGICSQDGIEISAQPISQTANNGTAKFSVEGRRKNGQSVSFQWQAKAPGQSQWTNINGATSNQLPLNNLKSSNNNASYRAVVSSAGIPSVTSGEATLNMLNSLSIVTQPTNGIANNGVVSFKVVVKTVSKPVIQWQRSVNSTAFTDIVGANSAVQSLLGLWSSSFSISDVSKEPVGAKYLAKITVGQNQVMTNEVSFQALASPLISSVEPKVGDPSTVVRILGGNFNGLSSVSVGGIPVAYVNKISDNEIVVVPSVNTRTGAVTVSNAQGIGTSRDSFLFANPFCSFNVDKQKYLLINSKEIVNDEARTRFIPGDSTKGAWSFVGLMAQIAPAGADLEEFIVSWLNNWSAVKQLNGFSVTPRDVSRILNDWPRDNAGKLDLSQAPFRLLAISNRIDMRSSVAADKRAGILNFVFGLYDQKPGSTYGLPLKFNVSFEFEMRTEVHSLIDWTLLWYKLGQANSSSLTYNSSLESITRDATYRNAKITKIVQSPFVNIRTEDFQFGNNGEFREFSLNLEGRLAQSPLKQTPDVSFNTDRKLELVQWINDNLSTVGSNKFEVKKEFLAGSSTVPASSWLSDADLSPVARSNFAMATCTGCHQSETRNSGIHVANRKADESSQISPFLKNELLVRDFEFKTMLIEMFCGQ